MKLSCSNTENNLLAKRINYRAADREQSVGGAFHTMNTSLLHGPTNQTAVYRSSILWLTYAQEISSVAKIIIIQGPLLKKPKKN